MSDQRESTSAGPVAGSESTPAAVPVSSASPARGPGAAASSAPVRRPVSVRYYVCVGILLLAALTMQAVANHLKVTFTKKAVPLKRPLVALDTAKLGPEYRLAASQPPPLNDEVLENLGTHEYLQWFLEDTRRPADDPRGLVHLFITYYTGKADPVPHNPEECYSAGGASLEGRTQITVTMPGPHGKTVQIPVKVLDFVPSARSSLIVQAEARPLVVAYFFYTNGKYETTRTGVRVATGSLFDRYAYYCKIEMTFTDRQAGIPANREQTEEATRDLLRKLMPILWADHFQDWDALKRGEAPVVLDR